MKLMSRSNIRFTFICIILYCISSTFMVFFFVNYYARFSTDIPGDGALKVNSLNVLQSHIERNDELSLEGWWQDQTSVTADVECYNEPWALCSRTFTVICKPASVRGLYQFVAFRSELRIRELQISARAQGEQLETHSGDAFIGVVALLHFNDSSNEFVKVSLASVTSSADISYASTVFKVSSRQTKYITWVTVSLSCSGYVGQVHFADVQLVPIVNAATVSKYYDIVDSCPRVGKFRSKKNLKIISLIGRSGTVRKTLMKDVALVTQLSMDRLWLLEQTLLYWDAPVSIVVYVALKKGEKLEDDHWQQVYIAKKFHGIRLHPESVVSIVYGATTEADEYPINVLRNVAINQSNCEHMLLVDADFQSSPEFHKHFLAATSSKVISVNTTNIAYVVPAFEYRDVPRAGDVAPRSKEELLQLMHRSEPFVQPFRKDVSPDSHRSTDYWRWYREMTPYLVSVYNSKYEPYVVVKKTPQLPLYDERFSGYGMNKITHIAELRAAGYAMVVVPNAWLIHLPHKTTSFFTSHLQNVEYRLRNRALRFEFVAALRRKYGMCTNVTRAQGLIKSDLGEHL